MNPHILYWKWNDDILDEKVMREKTLDIINRSVFDLIYICFHSVSPENRVMTSDAMLETVKKSVALFAEHGRKVLLDLDIPREPVYVAQNNAPYEGYVKTFRASLDDNGCFMADNEGACDIVGVWAVDFTDLRIFENKTDITDMAVIAENRFEISAGKENAGRGVIYCLYKGKKSLDRFSPQFDVLKRDMYERLKDSGIAGTATDEMGVSGLDTNIVQRNPQDTIYGTDVYDYSRVNAYADWLPFSEGMCIRYKERYGEDLKKSFIYLWNIEAGAKEKSIKFVNQYIENIRERLVEIETNHYNLTKEYFGKDAFCGVHPTWWVDAEDHSFDSYLNGLDWWEVKRDYAQTDELVIMPIRLAMARKCPENIWYNMWYSMRTMDIKTYYTETYQNVIYAGRTHHLGYECREPGVVLCMNSAGMLEGVSDMERKVDELDKLQTSRPASNVLVVFGYEAAVNHFISDPGHDRAERRTRVMHGTIKTTKEIFESSYLCELVPSTEIENKSVEFLGDKVKYAGHEYEALVVLYPEYISQTVYDEIKNYADNGGKLIVGGEVSVGIYGEKADFGNNAAYIKKVSAKGIVSELEALGIENRHGLNYCEFEDGSVTIAANTGIKKTGNGVKCEKYNIDDESADIVYIAPDGEKHIF